MNSIARETSCRYQVAMKYFFAALSLALLTGCATGDEDEKAFYNGGWLQPEKGANERMMRGGHDTSPITPQ
jgi:hypothetical protein